MQKVQNSSEKTKTYASHPELAMPNCSVRHDFGFLCFKD